MISNKPCVLVLLLVALLLLAACGGGGGGDGLRDSCAHLNCVPETTAVEKMKAMLADAEDGLIDEGDSELGDASIRAIEWLSNLGK